jgi:hypothetical protein
MIGEVDRPVDSSLAPRFDYCRSAAIRRYLLIL